MHLKGHCVCVGGGAFVEKGGRAGHSHTTRALASPLRAHRTACPLTPSPPPCMRTPPPPQAEALLEVSFAGLVLPHRMPPHTELLDLDPLPLAALGDARIEKLYTGRFTHFNPIQTQVGAGCGGRVEGGRGA